MINDLILTSIVIFMMILPLTLVQLQPHTVTVESYIIRVWFIHMQSDYTAIHTEHLQLQHTQLHFTAHRPFEVHTIHPLISTPSGIKYAYSAVCIVAVTTDITSLYTESNLSASKPEAPLNGVTPDNRPAVSVRMYTCCLCMVPVVYPFRCMYMYM